ncbi:MAG TPA: bifunctional diguanylate cyclase/phosphodiesterase [Acidobacteriaceae bacterium]|nr:bifunctional diguanylate cyclase/phosphodiesterase [Acidobacteriaceae bacterium]
MRRNGVTGFRKAVILTPVLCAGMLATALCHGSVLTHRTRIQELQALPLHASVHIIGMVTYVDAPGKLFWVQDETGAMPITVNPIPAGVRAGAAVSVLAGKTASLALEHVHVEPTTVGAVVAAFGEKAFPPTTAGLGPWHLAEGSVIRLTGVTSAQVAQNGLIVVQQDPATLQIERRWPADLAMVQHGPVWTPPAIPAALTIVFLMAFVFLLWVYILRRRVRRQMDALEKASETHKALREISSAMMAQVSTQREFTTQVAVQGGEEIAELVTGVNTILSELHRRERARREAETRLQHMALIDELTGLPNRRLLADRLSQSLALARRENRKMALLYIDLDGFKLVNDSLTLHIGDLLLRQVAHRLKARFRQSDTVARIAGDEFALILDQVQTWTDADVAAQGVLEVLKEPFEIEDHVIRVTASIGISLFPDHGNEGGQLLQQADCAMFAAKRNGKNRIVHYGDGLGSAARERLTLEGELRRAIENGDIDVSYQPEFDLSTNAIVRFEALARWTHPKLGRIPPGSFIPVAEESGLIVPLGAYVMERACADATTWQRKAGRPIQVAVNVSSVQFARDTFLEEVEEVLRRTGLKPSLLQLELTESATLTGLERAADLMRRLTGRGIGIAMDDFGTGYSCLSYLPKLAFDALKLDRSFVNELAVRPETRPFVQSILSMAHNLHMRVIVEGIETREQLDLMRSLGTDEAQGYLLGRPTPNPMELLSPNGDAARSIREIEAVAGR